MIDEQDVLYRCLSRMQECNDITTLINTLEKQLQNRGPQTFSLVDSISNYMELNGDAALSILFKKSFRLIVTSIRDSNEMNRETQSALSAIGDISSCYRDGHSESDGTIHLASKWLREYVGEVEKTSCAELPKAYDDRKQFARDAWMNSLEEDGIKSPSIRDKLQSEKPRWDQLKTAKAVRKAIDKYRKANRLKNANRCNGRPPKNRN